VNTHPPLQTRPGREWIEKAISIRAFRALAVDSPLARHVERALHFGHIAIAQFGANTEFVAAALRRR
jgi:hypothetical protein